MKRIRPIHGFAIVLLFAGVVWAADYALDGGFSHSGYIRVSPGDDGTVRIDVSDLEPNSVRFYRFLNYGNQEVLFLVGRDELGKIHVGFDASETHYKTRRGFSFQDGWMIDNKCETATRLTELEPGHRGGCRPVPMRHHLEGDVLVLKEEDVLAGWRLFR
ncbi:MAG: DUF2318 domain-containing protein [Acidobacteria bacterium]|nr:MAG: DUF2318 domain-containing protein [Acidobacteriota bacterium]